MGDIKLSRNELIQQIKRTRAIKDEIDRIIRETSNTHSILSRISEVSTQLARRELDNVRASATKASRELGNLCTSFNNAIRLYDEKEKEINKLVKIKGNSSQKRLQFNGVLTLRTLLNIKNTKIKDKVGNAKKTKLDKLKSLIEFKDNKWISSLKDEVKGALLEKV